MKFIKTILRFFFKFTGYLPLFLLLRQRYYKDNVKKKSRAIKGKAILISNHTHIMDYFTLLFAHVFRKQRFLVSEAVYAHPFLGFLNSIMDNILVHREKSDLSFMSDAENTLNRGGVISIFPEGKLYKDGSIGEFRPAFVYLSLRTNAPIIPHYIEGNYCKWKRTRIIQGEPIYAKDYLSDTPTVDEIKSFCELLRKKTLDLKRKMTLYKRYKTQNIFNLKAWFLDLAKVFLYIPTKIIFPTKFHYLDGASRKDRKIKGRALICSKHSSFSDAPILAMHYLSRRVHIVVTEELYDVMGWILDHFLSIKYKRLGEKSDPKCFMEIISLLKAEGVVGIYPEGHIKKDELGTIHDGVAYFALNGDAPIHFYYMARPYRPFHFNHIMIGKTIYPSDFFNKNDLKNKENIPILTSIIKAEMERLDEAAKPYKLKPKKAKN